MKAAKTKRVKAVSIFDDYEPSPEEIQRMEEQAMQLKEGRLASLDANWVEEWSKQILEFTKYHPYLLRPDQKPGDPVDWDYMTNRLVTGGAATLGEVGGLSFPDTLKLLKYWATTPPNNEAVAEHTKATKEQTRAIEAFMATLEKLFADQAQKGEPAGQRKSGRIPKSRSALDTDRIRKWKEDAVHTNKTLAHELFCSPEVVSSILNNGKRHGDEVLRRLAALMKVDFEDLFIGG
jgi:hypothetical protein